MFERISYSAATWNKHVCRTFIFAIVLIFLAVGLFLDIQLPLPTKQISRTVISQKATTKLRPIEGQMDITERHHRNKNMKEERGNSRYYLSNVDSTHNEHSNNKDNADGDRALQNHNLDKEIMQRHGYNMYDQTDKYVPSETVRKPSKGKGERYRLGWKKPKRVVKVYISNGNKWSNKTRPVVTVKDGHLYFITSSITLVPRKDLDIMNIRPLNFDPSYRNPCFYGNKTNGLMTDTVFHCLPYFYIIGVKKSGTTDLFARLSTHPHIITPLMKEAQWFPRIRFKAPESILQSRRSDVRKIGKAGVDNKNVTFYIHMYDEVAAKILSKTTNNTLGKFSINPYITVDTTSANLHLNRWWEILPGNEGLDEPRFTNINYIHHLNPAAKIIILFRDPVTRIFSDYIHSSIEYGKALDVSKFHNECTILTKAYTKCIMTNSLRSCAYNDSISRKYRKEGVVLAESFMASFYYIYMTDIYKTFDRENVMPILTTDYIHNMPNVLNQVLHFLELQPLTQHQINKTLHMPVSNQRYIKLDPMYDETRDMLYNFFAPFNKQMAQLMNDDRYLFKRK